MRGLGKTFYIKKNVNIKITYKKYIKNLHNFLLHIIHPSVTPTEHQTVSSVLLNLLKSYNGDNKVSRIVQDQKDIQIRPLCRDCAGLKKGLSTTK